ncbi:MAG: DUF4830 domain-containing protein [Ruminococcaceae bacterium]|nr:DUF4830 domain-containing protein [Oscillospiraceae bacterium]
MFVYSIKAANAKMFGLLLLSVAVVIAVVAVIPGYRSGSVNASDTFEIPVIKEVSPKSFKNVKSNNDRVAFLKNYGIEVQNDPSEILEVTVPGEFDGIYSKYNEMQKVEGLDLEKYRNKQVKRYTYIVTNYNYDGTVYANLLVYKNNIIGGDICSADINGFVRGFTEGNNILG